MNDFGPSGSLGVRTEPATLRFERVLPGPIERVWAYLTQEDLRRQWFAAGVMDLRPGAAFELVWRNHELSDPPDPAPEGSDGNRMTCRILACDPPRRLAFAFGAHGDVTIELAPEGDEVRLTLIHSRVPDHATLGRVGPGWHVHLDTLVARMRGARVASLSERMTRLRGAYATMLES